MKAIALWQPWASLWLGPKVHETRHWPTKYRGWLLVHASKHLESECGSDVDEVCINQFGTQWRMNVPRGAIIGAVKLEHCQPCDSVLRDFLENESPDNFVCGNFADGRYAWRRGDVVKFARPIPFRGSQGFFEVPHPVIREQFGEEIA